MPITADAIEKWEQLVYKDKLDQCLKAMTDAGPLDEAQENALTSLSARYYGLKSGEMAGTLDTRDHDLELNRIRQALIGLIRQIEAERLPAAPPDRLLPLGEDEPAFRAILAERLPEGMFSDLECLSNGDYSIIYRATRYKGQANEDQVALKVFKTISLIDEENRLEFQDKFAKAQDYSKGSGIITILEGNLHTLPRYFVMPLINGMLLSEKIALGWNFSLQEIREILASLYRTVWRGHRGGLLHLNLRPSNVIFDDAGEPQIFPFQIFHFNVSPQNVRRIRNLFRYWSPEQVNGQTISEHSDQYALGLIAFELFTLRPLFRGETVTEVIQRRLSFEHDPSILEQELAGTCCPPAFVPVIRRMLHPDPLQRFPDLDFVLDEINNLDLPREEPPINLHLLRRSFDRCRQEKHFYRTFYEDLFFPRAAGARNIFLSAFNARGRNPDDPSLWAYQHRMLDLAMDRILHFFADPSPIEDRLLQMAQNHQRWNIPPESFGLFMTCLKEAVASTDPDTWQNRPGQLDQIWTELSERMFRWMKVGG